MNKRQLMEINDLIKRHSQKEQECLILAQECHDKGLEERAIAYQCEGSIHGDIVIDLRFILNLEKKDKDNNWGKIQR